MLYGNTEETRSLLVLAPLDIEETQPHRCFHACRIERERLEIGFFRSALVTGFIVEACRIKPNLNLPRIKGQRVQKALHRLGRFALQTQKTPEFGEDRGIVGRYRRLTSAQLRPIARPARTRPRNDVGRALIEGGGELRMLRPREGQRINACVQGRR